MYGRTYSPTRSTRRPPLPATGSLDKACHLPNQTPIRPKPSFARAPAAHIRPHAQGAHDKKKKRRACCGQRRKGTWGQRGCVGTVQGRRYGRVTRKLLYATINICINTYCLHTTLILILTCPTCMHPSTRSRGSRWLSLAAESIQSLYLQHLDKTVTTFKLSTRATTRQLFWRKPLTCLAQMSPMRIWRQRGPSFIPESSRGHS